MTTLLKMTNIERHYDTPAGVVKALDGVTIEINEGERIILLGLSLIHISEPTRPY